MSSFGDIFNRFSLGRRWNRLHSQSHRRRRDRCEARKRDLREKRREKGERRTFEAAGAIFSVKVETALYSSAGI